MNQAQFNEILRNHKRVAIVGGPKTGKTTISNTVTDRPVHHNDDGMHIPWENQPAYWMAQVHKQDSFVIEGVQAARALRKGLQVDAVIELNQPFIPLNKGQAAMSKGHKKIFGDVLAANPKMKVYR